MNDSKRESLRDVLGHPGLRTNRRFFFGQASRGLGALGLSALLASETRAGVRSEPSRVPKVRRIIYLFQSGGPSQADLYDYKPQLRSRFGEELPPSVYPSDRRTTMTSAQSSFPIAPSSMSFSRHGDDGVWYSERLPYLARQANDICVIKSLHTDAINHDPAITFFQSGSQIPGRPSMGSWLSYGLGSETADLPAFVAMSSRGRGGGQPLYDRLWGSGFLPSRYQGVKFRNRGDPVLDISNPAGVDRADRRTFLDHLSELNRLRSGVVGDPEIETRIAQYELAFRMQSAVPDLLDFSTEPQHVLDLYGPQVKKQGTYAYNCLVARRLAERGVRFIQLFHQGWDQHGNLPQQISKQCRDTDQPSAALIRDLKQRGMLDDTLIVWGGEFGRTIYCQGKLTKKNYGRDHHAGCFSIWLAGGGVRGGMSYGETDDYSVNVATDGVSVHDVHATMLQLCGIDHERLTHRFQGRDYRLTDVAGRIVNEILV
ncbi:MAG: DUF1501 domain-containing protein [Planctomycetota bacterium]